MCFATPLQIVALENNQAIGDNGRRVFLDLVDSCKVGDWILCQANMAVEKIDKKKAKEMRARDIL